MDLLAGYGSGSDYEDEGAPNQTTVLHKWQNHHPAPAQHVHAARKAAGAGSVASLPSPKAPPVDNSRNAEIAGSGWPAGFFESSSDAASVVAGLPVGFFDTPTAVRAATTPADADVKLVSSPARPSPALPADIPKPSDPELWKKLPAPRTAAGKRKVMFRAQINMELLAGSDSDDHDDETAAKRPKAAAGTAGKPSVLSFLPAPKNQPAAPKSLSSGSRLPMSESRGTPAPEHPQQQPSPAASTHTAGPGIGNEAYRLAQPAVVTAGQYEQYQPSEQQHHQHHQLQYYAGSAAAFDHSGHGHSSGYDPSTAAAVAAGGATEAAYPSPEEALLQEALQAEAAKAARRAAGGGSAQLVMPDIQFKEVKADKIKYVGPAQREAAQGMRAALGTDYAVNLRSQAAPHMGSKLARSKHQIGTLFANAKLRELEVLENRAAGMKSKSETAGKYGWK